MESSETEIWERRITHFTHKGKTNLKEMSAVPSSLNVLLSFLIYDSKWKVISTSLSVKKPSEDITFLEIVMSIF